MHLRFSSGSIKNLCLLGVIALVATACSGQVLQTNPKFRVEIVGVAPDEVTDVSDVSVGPSGEFYLAAGTTYNANRYAIPTSEILTAPDTAGGTLRVYGTLPAGYEPYGRDGADISVSPTGQIFLTTRTAVLTGPSSPGGPLNSFGTCAYSALFPVSPAFDKDGHIYLPGCGSVVVTDPAIPGGELTVFGKSLYGVSKGPFVASDGRVFISAYTETGHVILTNPQVPGGEMSMYFAIPPEFALPESGPPNMAVSSGGQFMIVGVRRSDWTGGLLTKDGIYGTAPQGGSLYPNPFIAENGSLFISTGNGIATEKPGQAMEVFGTLPGGNTVLKSDTSIKPVAPDGTVFVWGISTYNEPGIYTNPEQPGGELVPIITFVPGTFLGNPSTDYLNRAYVSVKPLDGRPYILRVSRGLTNVSLESSPNPSDLGEPVNITATVTASEDEAPTGTVTFKDGSTTIGSGTLTSGLAALQTSTLSAGSHSITASYSGNSTFAVSTSPVMMLVVRVQSITVTPATASIPKGTTYRFSASATASDNTTRDLTNQVSWSSSDGSVASIDAQGMATGIAVGGPIAVTASLGSVVGAAKLTVTVPVLLAVEVSPVGALMPLGASQQYSATAVYSDKTTRNVTSSAVWSSSNANVAPIATKTGLVKTAKLGSSTVTASFGGLTGTTTLTTYKFSVSPTLVKIGRGTIQRFSATGTFANGSTLDLTSLVSWSSSKNSVATISSTGVATAFGSGTTTILAKTMGVQASATLGVH
jgi:hypothetical protein